jgi:tripartite ATP-independent transporter DctM subunit
MSTHLEDSMNTVGVVGLKPHKSFQKRLDFTIDLVVSFSILGQVFVMFANIICRWLFDYQLDWSQEIATIALATITFVGGAVAYSRGEHMAIELVIHRLSPRWQQIWRAFSDWMIFYSVILAGILAIPEVYHRISEVSPIMGISGSYFILPLPVGMILLAVIALQRLWAMPERKSTIITGLVTLLVLLLIVWARETTGPLGLSSVVLWGTLGGFIFLLAVGVPIAFVLMILAFYFIYTSGQAPVLAIPTTMYSGITNYVLLAIPIFVYAGYIMTEGGLSRRLSEAVIAVIGRMRGGLLQVMVVSIYIVSGISGSKVADVVAVGSTMDSILRGKKYNMNESAAVLAASAVMGETVPPSTPMLVLGSISALSVGSLFMAGLLPAALLGIVLMGLVYVRSKKLGLEPGPRVPFGQAIAAVLSGIPSMLVPVFLIGGIMAGIATPTEVSAIAVVYAIALATIFYREMNVRSFYRALSESTAKAGMVLFIIASASAFSWALSVVQLPNKLIDFLTSLGATPWLFMVGTVITLIITGAVLEGMPALIILGPMLLPVAEKFGIHPLHYGIVLIMAMGFGTFTPPIGIGTYVTCSITKTSMEQTGRHMIPYLIVLFFGIVAVAFFPWVTLIIPYLMHMIT